MLRVFLQFVNEKQNIEIYKIKKEVSAPFSQSLDTSLIFLQQLLLSFWEFQNII